MYTDHKMDNKTLSCELPGFRFHPTEEELIDFYLRNIIFGKKREFVDVIGFLNIYRHDPWDLPGMAKIGEREWYFFVPRDRKQSNGGRPSRTTEHGFWKATGSDRKVVTLLDPKRVIGYRKTLVFYKGRAPRGTKTDWVMNEFRLSDNCHLPKDIVLCKVYRKATSLKVLEQWAALEDEETVLKSVQFPESPYPPSPSLSLSNRTAAAYTGPARLEDLVQPMSTSHVEAPRPPKAEEFELDPLVLEAGVDDNKDHRKVSVDGGLGSRCGTSRSLALPSGAAGLTELQVPRFGMDPLVLEEGVDDDKDHRKVSVDGGLGYRCGTFRSLALPSGADGLTELQVPSFGMDLAQDPFLAQLRSPWLDNILNQFTPPNLLNI